MSKCFTSLRLSFFICKWCCSMGGGGPGVPVRSCIQNAQVPQPPPSAGGPDAKPLSAPTSSSVGWDCEPRPPVTDHRAVGKEEMSQELRQGSVSCKVLSTQET